MVLDIASKKIPLTISTDYYLKQYEFEEQLRSEFQKIGVTENFSDVRDEFIIFDLSNTYWHDLGSLLWFISLLNKLKRQSNELQLIFPEPTDSKSEKTWDFLIRWRFFKTLSMCVDDPINLLKPYQVPHLKRKSQYSDPFTSDSFDPKSALHSSRLLEITTILADYEASNDDTPLGRFLGLYKDKIIFSALRTLCGWDGNLTKNFVHYVIKEGLENSFAHSEGSFSNISMRLDPKYLTLVITDNGIGIPSVLRDAFMRSATHKDRVAESDVDLIKFFTEPEMVLDSSLIKVSTARGTTSRRERKGFGLYYLKSQVLNDGGALRIRSGRACVDFEQSGENSYDNMLTSPGTMLKIRAPLRK